MPSPTSANLHDPQHHAQSRRACSDSLGVLRGLGVLRAWRSSEPGGCSSSPPHLQLMTMALECAELLTRRHLVAMTVAEAPHLITTAKWQMCLVFDGCLTVALTSCQVIATAAVQPRSCLLPGTTAGFAVHCQDRRHVLLFMKLVLSNVGYTAVLRLHSCAADGLVCVVSIWVFCLVPASCRQLVSHCWAHSMLSCKYVCWLQWPFEWNKLQVQACTCVGGAYASTQQLSTTTVQSLQSASVAKYCRIVSSCHFFGKLSACIAYRPGQICSMQRQSLHQYSFGVVLFNR